MDIYDTRAQLAAIDLMEPEYTFLHDMTVRDGGTVEDDKAIYDFRKGSRKMAPVVHAGTGGVLMEREGFQTREIGFATIAAGDSHNDLGMIQASKAGFLFKSTEQIKREHPELPAYEEFDDLLEAIKGAL